MKIYWAILLVLLVGCGRPEPKAGTVVAKAFNPSTTIYVWISTDSNGGGYLMPIITPDSWQLKIQQADHSQGWRTVSKDDFERCHVNSQVEYGQ